MCVELYVDVGLKVCANEERGGVMWPGIDSIHFGPVGSDAEPLLEINACSFCQAAWQLYSHALGCTYVHLYWRSPVTEPWSPICVWNAAGDWHAAAAFILLLLFFVRVGNSSQFLLFLFCRFKMFIVYSRFIKYFLLFLIGILIHFFGADREYILFICEPIVFYNNVI